MLVEQKMLDLLIVKRTKLIEVYTAMLKAKRDAWVLINEMDEIVPTTHAAYLDNLTTMYHAIDKAFGENHSNRFAPREFLMSGKTDEEIEQLVTQTVDRRLWDSCYNRMNVYSLMTDKEKNDFAEQDYAGVIPFNMENVTSTLMALFNSRHDMMVNKLMSVVIENENRYKSNEGFKFGPRIVLESACQSLKFTSSVLKSTSPLYTVLTALENVINGHKASFDNGAFKHASLWNELKANVDEQQLDIGQLDDVDLGYGITVRLFKKGTVHVMLKPHLVAALNDLLSKTKSLSPVKSYSVKVN